MLPDRRNFSGGWAGSATAQPLEDASPNVDGRVAIIGTDAIRERGTNHSCHAFKPSRLPTNGCPDKGGSRLPLMSASMIGS
jgi:hypothetical protein